MFQKIHLMNKKKQMKLILVVYFLEDNGSKTSPQHITDNIINIKF